MNFKNLLRRAWTRAPRRKPLRHRTTLFLEALEDRLVPSGDPGQTLTGTTPPTWNQLYGPTNQPAVSDVGFYTGQYAGPGTNPLVPLAQGGNTNLPFIVNGSPSFNQPVQTSDWWSNLMLRLDPTTVGGVSYAYSNAALISEPALLQFQNNRFDGDNPWVQGLGIDNPAAFGIDPGTVGPNTDTQRTLSLTPSNVPLIVGIGGNTSTNTDTRDKEITPLGTPGSNPANGIDENKLNVRVNHYSDWGVQVVYGDGNPNDPTDPADPRNNALTIDMFNGSPFTYFTKSSTGAATNAFAKVWLRGTQVPGNAPALPVNVVWGQGQLPSNVLAVTLTTNILDASGTLQTSTSSYLVIASSGSWTLRDENNSGGQPQNTQLWVNPMASGTIVTALLPHYVGSTRFENLSLQDQINVAKEFLRVAANFPQNNSSATQVSDPTTGFNPKTGLVTTTYTVRTVNSAPTYQLLYPNQYNYLSPANQGQFLTYTPLDGPDKGIPVQLTYTTLLGTARVYAGNSFTTQVQFHGVLNDLPSVAVQTNPLAAEALYQAVGSYMQRYIVDPAYAVGITDNTYDTSLMLLSQTLQEADELASPSSLLSPAERAQATLWRDRLLQGLKTELFTWFDLSTGRLFQYNSTYDTLIGYPAGFGSDTTVNDHHFHYGYFLSAFATVGQFDPGFLQSMLPQIQLLVNDVANANRSSTQFPFLREFNPWAGHSWANGLGRGGEDEESASESVNFSAGLIRLGAELSNPGWVAEGAYLYQTEIEAMNQYWFNVNANPALGNFGNYAQAFAQYLAGGNVVNVTQIANVNQTAIKRTLFFDSPNYAEATYAINWLPTAAWMLFLGGNQDYLQRNWAQFVADYHLDGRNGVNEAVVAGYQALMPDQGFGLDQPGATNALLRLDPDQNPAFAPTSQSDPGFKGGYLGTNRAVALNWIYELQALGQVDYSVVADTTSYGVFLKGGQRTFVAYNPTSAPLTVNFSDRASGQPLLTLTVQPHQMLTRLPDGTLISDRSGVAAVSTGTNLYLTKPAGQDPNQPANLTLSLKPGSTVPTPVIGVNPTQQQILAAYAGTYTQVPQRPGDITNNGNTPPGDSGTISFSINNLTGTYNGGQTGLQLFLDNALTWKADRGPDPKFGFQYGPGVVQNLSLGSPTAVIRVTYHFDNNPLDDRVETYTAQLSGVNQFNLFDNITPNTGTIDPNVPQTTTLTLVPSLSNLQPFLPMNGGSVTVSLWQGNWSSSDNSHKEYSVSVNADPNMARSSRLVIPYTNGAAGPAVLQIDPPPHNPVGPAQPIGTLTVHLSQPASPGAFTYRSLALTYNGTAVQLTSAITVTQDAQDPRTYHIGGLAAYTPLGTYVLSVIGGQIKDPNNPSAPAGTGAASVSWSLDNRNPGLQLLSDAPGSTATAPIPVTAYFNEPVTGFSASDLNVTNATVSNFRGSGQLYAFDLTPTRPGVSVTVSVAAGAARDAAGNPSTAASLIRNFTGTGPVVSITSDAGNVTNQASIPVTVKFSAVVSGFTAASLVLGNATVNNFAPGGSSDTFTFNLVPAGPGRVTIDVPAGVARDAQNRPNEAAATFARTFDNAAPTGVMTSIANYLTYSATIPIVVQFSQPVTGFDLSKVSVTNGTVDPASLKGSGASYAFNVTASDIGVVLVNIAAGAAVDAAGNPSTAFTPLSRAFRVIPTATLSSTTPFPTTSTSVPFQIAFNEAMALDPSKINVTNGVIIGGAAGVTTVNGALYTFSVQPTASPVTVTLLGSAAFDAYGNGNPSQQVIFNYGTPPRISGATAVHNGTNGFLDVTLNFDQGVQSLDASKLLVVDNNATITDFSGAGNSYVFKLTPRPSRANYGSELSYTLDVPAGAIVSDQGIPNQDTQITITPASVQNGPFTITGPTVVMTAASEPLPKYAGGTIHITATFSESVINFNWNNLIVTGGSVPQDSFKAQTGGTVYTFDLTPNGPGTSTVVLNTTGPTVIKTTDGKFNAMPNPAPLNRIVTSPVVTDVTSSVAPGTYHAGAQIPILVTFNSRVKVVGTPMLALNSGGTAHNALAVYTGSSQDGTVLTFLYTVQPGQNTAALDMDAVAAMRLQNGAAILDPGTNNPLPADQLLLFTGGVPHSLPANKAIVIDTANVTRVVSVSGTLANGTYGAGQVIPIQVRFSSPVVVTGTPRLLLAGVGDDAIYTGGSGSNILTFEYLVGGNQESLHLDYSNSKALNLDGGTITAQNGTPVDLTLPGPGAPGSLSFNNALAVAALAPKVLSVSTTSRANTTYGPGQTIVIQVNFSEAVAVTGSPLLRLSSGGVATYTPGGPSNSLTFTYVVQAGQSSSNLDVASSTALDLNGGTIRDLARVTTDPGFQGNDADLTLPQPGAAASLSNISDNRNLKVAGVAPTVVAVFSAVNGARSNGDGLTIFVKFSNQLVLSQPGSSSPTLAMSDGGTATFTGFVKEGKGAGNTLTFLYSPLQSIVNDGVSHLDVANATALSLNGCTLTDLGGNTAVLTLPVGTQPGSLASSNLIAIHTNPFSAPTVVNVTSPPFQGTFGIGAVVPITVRFSTPVVVTGTPQLLLSSGGMATYVSGSETRTLTFNYVVGAGDNAARLDEASTTALSVPGGTITNVFGQNGNFASADLTLPVPGTVGSLGANTRIVVDTATTAVPVVVGITALNPPGAYRAGQVITIAVHFNRAVTVPPSAGKQVPTLLLQQEQGLQDVAATYSSGSGTDTLIFTYKVGAGQNSAALDEASAQALILNGATIADRVSGRSASADGKTVRLPAPGQAGSLRDNDLIFADGLLALLRNPFGP
jgi:hypothetical protein